MAIIPRKVLFPEIFFPFEEKNKFLKEYLYISEKFILQSINEHAKNLAQIIETFREEKENIKHIEEHFYDTGFFFTDIMPQLLFNNVFVSSYSNFDVYLKNIIDEINKNHEKYNKEIKTKEKESKLDALKEFFKPSLKVNFCQFGSQLMDNYCIVRNAIVHHDSTLTETQSNNIKEWENINICLNKLRGIKIIDKAFNIEFIELTDSISQEINKGCDFVDCD